MVDNNKKFGVMIATAMSVTVVVGAGLLALPGLSFAQAGRLGYLPWLLVAALMVPLLEIFSFFSKKNPSAGGVVGYVRASLGSRMATVCEVIVLGTFTLGIPAIALIGGAYLQQSLMAAPVAAVAAGMVTLAFVAGVVGLRLSGALQTGIAIAIVLGLVAVLSGFLTSSPVATNDVSIAANSTFSGVLSAIPLILFAFTGWEMTAFLAEDMRNPQKDMATSIWASFLVVTCLYLGIAWSVATYGTAEPGWTDAPVAKMAYVWLGADGGRWVGFIAALLVIANVIAAFVSASRAIFSAGRDGLLPRFIGVSNRQDQPIRAMALTYILFTLVILSTLTGLVKVDTLLQLAGQNFFVLYLLAALGYTRLQRHSARRWIGGFAVLLVAATMFLFSALGLIYCAVLVAIGLCVSYLQSSPKARLIKVG